MKVTTLSEMLIQATSSLRAQRSNPCRSKRSPRALSRLSMTRESPLFVMAVLGFPLVIAGCVTINIYFPASAAEKAADKIIDEVWQAKGSGNAPTVPSTDKVEKP